MKSFSAQISDTIAREKRKLTAVMRQSVSDVIEQAQTPVGKGGFMRVDTGFLRASGQASLNGLPTGPTRGASGDTFTLDDSNTIVTIGNFDVGATFFFGWTANYAAIREVRDGFLETSVQNWQEIVNANVQKVQAL